MLFIQPALLFRPLLHPPRVHRDEHADQDRDRNPRKGTRDIFDSYIHLFGVRLNPTYTYSEWSLNFTFLFQSVLGSHVNLFGVEPELYASFFGARLNPTYTYSEWSLNFTFLFRGVLDSHVYSFGAFLNSTNTY